MKKRLLSLGLAALLLLAALPALTSCSYEETDEVTTTVAIDVQLYGTIVIELYPDVAPITVANFQKLVAEGFYNGSGFHRIIEGFMIQGGRTPLGKADPPEILGEFAANGVENDLKHERGVISMARTDFYDSASSEFFIVHETENATHLDGYYAAFGRVVDGMDVVDAIAEARTNYNDAPLLSITIERAYFVK